MEEAKLVGQIIANADGGCESCVGVLREMCEETWPQFTWSMSDDWYGEGYDNRTIEVEEKSIG